MPPFHPGTLLLAPLQGVTDGIFRELLTDLGGIDACLSVYARVSREALPAKSLLRTCPELAQGGRTRANVRVHLQLLGSDPEALAKTAQHAVEAGAPALDINFGCPMGRVNRHDGGAALLKHPDRITRILRTVRDAIPESVPLSAKLRIGWSHPTEVVPLAHAVEQGGASFMTLHARTRDQLYQGRANWSAIGLARAAVTIPIVANGDIRTPDDLAQCAEQTGCQSFMIGRGALARPELFRLLAGIEARWWPAWRRLELLEIYGSTCESRNLPPGSVVGRVKGWWRYMAEADEDIARAFTIAKRQDTWPSLLDSLRGAMTQLRGKY